MVLVHVQVSPYAHVLIVRNIHKGFLQMQGFS